MMHSSAHSRKKICLTFVIFASHNRYGPILLLQLRSWVFFLTEYKFPTFVWFSPNMLPCMSVHFNEGIHVEQLPESMPIKVMHWILDTVIITIYRLRWNWELAVPTTLCKTHWINQSTTNREMDHENMCCASIHYLYYQWLAVRTKTCQTSWYHLQLSK
jgi:hypothetical protein